MFISLVVHYVRPKQSVYVRETLQGVIRELVEAGGEIDLEADPSNVSVVKLLLMRAPLTMR